ncbi:hypothetical protein JR782_001002 [Salmonella enterica subsp. enterica serovar Eastbourne]|nr:hypothetical protein [Salmonella enterica subsp. enterica serovar Eastbourne]EHC5906694.1 hypothetical protein [Salmonella enterica subsp. enterica serovar Eastbourne]
MKYLPNFLADLIVAALLAVGIGMNIEGSTATAHGFLWVCAIAGILACLLPDVTRKTAEEYTHRPLLWAAYDLISDLAFVAVAAWLNWYVLAVFMLLALALKQEFCRKQEKRLKEQAT